MTKECKFPIAIISEGELIKGIDKFDTLCACLCLISELVTGAYRSLHAYSVHVEMQTSQ